MREEGKERGHEGGEAISRKSGKDSEGDVSEEREHVWGRMGEGGGLARTRRKHEEGHEGGTEGVWEKIRQGGGGQTLLTIRVNKHTPPSGRRVRPTPIGRSSDYVNGRLSSCYRRSIWRQRCSCSGTRHPGTREISRFSGHTGRAFDLLYLFSCFTKFYIFLFLS